MGSYFTFLCPTCGYTNPHCCGGTEAGMAVTLSTVLCTACKQLYDVPVVDHSSFAEVPIRCPRNKLHAVALWSQPGPCPKCGTVLPNQGESEIWD